MEKLQLKIQKNQKIRDFLLNYGFSSSQVNKILKNKDVKLDGKRLEEDAEVCSGQTVVVFAQSLPQKKFDVLFEDENVVVVNKSIGIEVEGKEGLEGKLNAIAVHRLDRNTTGIVILAKNAEVENALKEAFKQKEVQKKYVCEVFGSPKFDGKAQNAYLVKDAKRSEVKIYQNFVQGAVKISAAFKTVKQGGQTSLVEVDLLTGRTHQIRAQLAFLGYPIIGDGKYGKNEINKKFKQKYQKLHCFYLKIKKISPKFEYLTKQTFICKPQWAEKYV